LCLSCGAFCDEPWENVAGAINDLDLRVIMLDPVSPGVIYAGSSKRLYRSADEGRIWEPIFAIHGEGILNFIAIDEKDPSVVYSAASNGLFKTLDGGDNWRRIFKGIGEGEREVVSVAVHPFDSDVIYAGTGQGLFNSKDGGKSWHKLSSAMDNSAVDFIAANPALPDVLYVAASRGVFKTIDLGTHWKRVFVTDEASAEEIEPEEEKSRNDVNCIAISQIDPNKVYLGTGRGLFVSDDGGENWQKMSSTGLEGGRITFIIPSKAAPGRIYTATDKGVFIFEQKNRAWRELYKGITANRISMIALDVVEGCMWAAAEGGIFKIALGSSADEDPGRPIPDFSEEPPVREIQEAAIKYAEVAPDKIRRWRRGAKFRALLPEFSLDYDKTINYDSGSDAYYIGPRDWGVSLKWDLADLIWNPYQKDIDVRSRLMVQLRDDVLDEVTHLYYERKRLQGELLGYAPNDTRSKVDRELRLQELTASIDALTGGYLSAALDRQ